MLNTKRLLLIHTIQAIGEENLPINIPEMILKLYEMQILFRDPKNQIFAPIKVVDKSIILCAA